MSANRIEQNGVYIGFVWTEKSLSGETEWHVEDWRGIKRPQPFACYDDCWDWLVDRSKKRVAA